MIDPTEKSRRRPFDTVTMLIVKPLCALARVEHDRPRTGFLRPLLEGSENQAPKAATLRPGIDRHEADLCLRG